ncbi:MAG: WGR domain-containing protein [Nitrospirales bacterium]|nr:WGR domain-containing protein [Nitrospirales bacterium]
MMDEFHIKLEAKNPDKGNFRAYEIDAGPDLLGQWQIEVKYGRIGRRGRSVTYSAADDAGAAAIIRHCLKRRSTAPKRIGVPYQVRELWDPKKLAGVNL